MEALVTPLKVDENTRFLIALAIESRFVLLETKEQTFYQNAVKKGLQEDQDSTFFTNLTRTLLPLPEKLKIYMIQEHVHFLKKQIIKGKFSKEASNTQESAIEKKRTKKTETKETVDFLKHLFELRKKIHTDTNTTATSNCFNSISSSLKKLKELLNSKSSTPEFASFRELLDKQITTIENDVQTLQTFFGLFVRKTPSSQPVMIEVNGRKLPRFPDYTVKNGESDFNSSLKSDLPQLIEHIDSFASSPQSPQYWNAILENFEKFEPPKRDEIDTCIQNVFDSYSELSEWKGALSKLYLFLQNGVKQKIEEEISTETAIAEMEKMTGCLLDAVKNFHIKTYKEAQIAAEVEAKKQALNEKIAAAVEANKQTLSDSIEQVQNLLQNTQQLISKCPSTSQEGLQQLLNNLNKLKRSVSDIESSTLDELQEILTTIDNIVSVNANNTEEKIETTSQKLQEIVDIGKDKTRFKKFTKSGDFLDTYQKLIKGILKAQNISLEEERLSFSTTSEPDNDTYSTTSEISSFEEE